MDMRTKLAGMKLEIDMDGSSGTLTIPGMGLRQSVYLDTLQVGNTSERVEVVTTNFVQRVFMPGRQDTQIDISLRGIGKAEVVSTQEEVDIPSISHERVVDL